MLRYLWVIKFKSFSKIHINQSNIPFIITLTLQLVLNLNGKSSTDVIVNRIYSSNWEFFAIYIHIMLQFDILFWLNVSIIYKTTAMPSIRKLDKVVGKKANISIKNVQLHRLQYHEENRWKCMSINTYVSLNIAKTTFSKVLLYTMNFLQYKFWTASCAKLCIKMQPHRLVHEEYKWCTADVNKSHNEVGFAWFQQW